MEIKKKNKELKIKIRKNIINRDNFVSKFKEFFSITDDTIETSLELHDYLRDFYKYNTSIIILNFLNTLEDFEDNFKISHNKIKLYISNLRDTIEGFYETNRSKTRRTLLLRKFIKHADKFGLEIISFY